MPLALAYLGAAWALERRGRSLPPAGSRFDAIVVLGCPVAPDGGPSPALVRRAALAARLFHLGHAPRVVTTGGSTRARSPAEAVALARLLHELGVPRGAVVVEDRSRTTEENARFARRLLPDAERVLIATDAFHVPRACLLFRRHFDHVSGAGAVGSAWARTRGAVRELPAAIVHALVGR